MMRLTALLAGCLAVLLSAAQASAAEPKGKKGDAAGAEATLPGLSKGKKGDADKEATPALPGLTKPKGAAADASLPPLGKAKPEGSQQDGASAAGAKPDAKDAAAAKADPAKGDGKPADLKQVDAVAPADPVVELKAAEAPAPAEPAEPRKLIGLHAAPRVGFGYAAESEVGENNPTFTFGATVGYAINKDMAVDLTVSDQLYRRTYVSSRPDLSQQGAASAGFDEQKVSIDALFSYQLLGLFKVQNPKPKLAVQVGPSFRLFDNEAFSSQAGGIAIGGRAGWALSDSLDVSAGGLYGYNLFFKNEGLLSAHGGPKAVGSYDGSVGLKLAPNTRFAIGYEGEVLVLQSSYRLYHALAFNFDLAF